MKKKQTEVEKELEKGKKDGLKCGTNAYKEKVNTLKVF